MLEIQRRSEKEMGKAEKLMKKHFWFFMAQKEREVPAGGRKLNKSWDAHEKDRCEEEKAKEEEEELLPWKIWMKENKLQGGTNAEGYQVIYVDIPTWISIQKRNTEVGNDMFRLFKIKILLGSLRKTRLMVQFNICGPIFMQALASLIQRCVSRI